MIKRFSRCFSNTVQQEYDVVVVGTGIIGSSCAFHLTKRGANVLLVDMNSPVNLTSTLSTECYRDFWPHAPMRNLVTRSIELMEQLSVETENEFSLTRQGYVIATCDDNNWSAQKNFWDKEAIETRTDDVNYQYGVGLPHWSTQPTGMDLLNAAPIRKHFPYLSQEVVGVIHARRCGWVAAQQLGQTMFRRSEATFLRGRVKRIGSKNGKINHVLVDTKTGPTEIRTKHVINATGPFLQNTHELIDQQVDQLPVFSEIHAKCMFRDHLEIIPRDAPMLIYDDHQYFTWEDDELIMIQENADDFDQRLAAKLPPGVHLRPYGGMGSNALLLLWECWHGHRKIYSIDDTHSGLPDYSKLDPMYPEICLRGLSRMIPGFQRYLDGECSIDASIDAGYYTRTKENVPLIGSVPNCPDGYYLAGCVSGYGIMASMATGELMAQIITDKQHLPDYATLMSPYRYQDGTLEAYEKQYAHLGDGQI